jgi:hypothetical protein
MDWLQFASDLTASLVWPAVVIGLVVYLRGEVRSVAQALVRRMGDLKKLSAGAVSAEFEKAASEVAQRTDAIADVVGKGELPVSETHDESKEIAVSPIQQEQESEERRRDKIDRLLEQDARAVVLLEFIEVESALTELYNLRYGSTSPKSGFNKMVNQLVRDGTLDADVAGVLKDLAGLRNEISHEPDTTVTEEAARRYAEAASTALRLLSIAQAREVAAATSRDSSRRPAGGTK